MTQALIPVLNITNWRGKAYIWCCLWNDDTMRFIEQFVVVEKEIVVLNDVPKLWLSFANDKVILQNCAGLEITRFRERDCKIEEIKPEIYSRLESDFTGWRPTIEAIVKAA